MLIRFSFAILFAVLVAASRPVASGGDHEILAVGVRWEETIEVERGGRVEKVTKPRLSIATPTADALAAHRAILKTSARAALLQGSTVFATTPAEAPPGPRILELVYYGTGRHSRAGRAPVAFGGTAAAAPAAFVAAHEAARAIAALPSSVTEAGARILLQSPDDLSFRDALEALLGVKADAASAAALRTALSSGPGGASRERRVLAVQVLRDHLGGAAAYPAAFRTLRASDDPVVAEAASR
jgi:hypothetical protein